MIYKLNKLGISDPNGIYVKNDIDLDQLYQNIYSTDRMTEG